MMGRPRTAVPVLTPAARAANTAHALALYHNHYAPSTQRNRNSVLHQYEAFVAGNCDRPAWPVVPDTIGPFIAWWSSKAKSPRIKDLTSVLRTE